MIRRGALLIVLCLVCALANAAKFTTQNFDFRSRIEPDGTLSVRETIDLTFTEPQRGIIRKLPSKTRNAAGRARTVGYELVLVQQNSGGGFERAETSVSDSDGVFSIRIGNRNRLLTGRVTYLIDYRVTGALISVKKTDKIGPRIELIWNALPTNWPTDIEHAAARVAFPKPTRPNLLARILLGEPGTRNGIEIDQTNHPTPGDGRVTAQFVQNALEIKANRPLRQGETISFDLGLPEGTARAEPPQITYEATPTIPPPPRPTNPLFALLPLLTLPIIYFVSRSKWVPYRPLVVQFEPPSGVDAPCSGVLIDGKADRRDIVAGLITLAQKGAVRMHHSTERGTGVDIELIDDRSDLTPFESSLFRSLVPFGPVVSPASLRGSFGASYFALTSQLYQDISAKGYRTAEQAWTGLLLFTLIVVFGCAGAFLGGPAVVGASLVGVIGGIWMLTKTSSLTPIGQDVVWRLKGLREFISRAQEREMVAMSKRQPDQALFEELLPYAVAFGLVKQWSDSFAGIELQPPDWYVGDGYYDPTQGIWTAVLIGDLIDFDTSFTDALSFAPGANDSGDFFSGGDSGFGGGSDGSGGFDGGFDAGGGGGGGGGDSW